MQKSMVTGRLKEFGPPTTKKIICEWRELEEKLQQLKMMMLI
jgi:hypothetical protein